MDLNVRGVEPKGGPDARRDEAAVALIPRSNDADGPFWLNPKGTREHGYFGPIALSPLAYSGGHCGARGS
jgi:hypothetical protein